MRRTLETTVAVIGGIPAAFGLIAAFTLLVLVPALLIGLWVLSWFGVTF